MIVPISKLPKKTHAHGKGILKSPLDEKNLFDSVTSVLNIINNEGIISLDTAKNNRRIKNGL